MNWLLTLSSLAVMVTPAVTWQYILPDALPSDSLSESCKAALVVELNCASQVGNFFEREAVPPASLQEACTSACGTSLANFEASLKSECSEEDVVEYESGRAPVHVSIIATDIYYHFSRTCIKDGDRWCNVWAFQSSSSKATSFGASTKAAVTPAVNICDNCYIKPLQFQAGTSYSNGYDLQGVYISLTKSCSKTGFPLKTTVTSKPSATTDPAMPSCSGDVYTIKSGDTCRSVSKANSLATSWMLYDNGLQAFCNDFPPAGQQICIINKCKIYTIKADDTCQSIAAAAKISMVQLYTWNPVLGESCSRLSLSLGHTICLEPHNDADFQPITRTATTKMPRETTAPVPSNIAQGTNKRCAQFYSVQVGDYCNQIILRFSISLQDFLFLNQGINKECTNLLAKESYCVSPVGPINMYPGHPDYINSVTANPGVAFKSLANATFTAPAITDLDTYLPQANYTRADCHIFMDGADLQVNMQWKPSSSPCMQIAKVWQISLEDLQNWNPSLNTSSPDCAFDKRYSYCLAAYQKVDIYISEPNEMQPSTIAKATATTTTPTATNGISTPVPTQSGMIHNCNKFHLIKTTTTCKGIADYNKISISNFYKWNPKVNSDCSNLTLDSWACAGISDSASQQPTTTTTTNGISTPLPVQTGMVSNCNKFHIVKSTTTCQGITDYNKITMANLLKWNPGINSGCSNLSLGSSVCVGIIGGSAVEPTATTSNGGVSTPTAIQPGMTTGCTKFHPVRSTTTCQGILDYNKITLKQFYKWNPAVKNDCSNLWPNTYACVVGP